MLKFSPSEFWAATLGELLTALYYHYEDEKRRQRGEWERMRLLAYLTVKPHYGKQIKRPEDILNLEWDKKEQHDAKQWQWAEEVNKKWEEADKAGRWQTVDLENK